MRDKFILLLAFDALLLELDEDYESPPDEQINLIKSKILEGYGLTVNSSKNDLIKVNELLIQDIKKTREQLIEEIL